MRGIGKVISLSPPALELLFIELYITATHSYEGPPSPEDINKLSEQLGHYWANVDVEEEIRRLRR